MVSSGGKIWTGVTSEIWTGRFWASDDSGAKAKAAIAQPSVTNERSFMCDLLSATTSAVAGLLQKE